MEHMIPIFGIIFVIGPIASLVFSYTPLGKAIIERLRGRSNTSDDSLLQLQDEIDRLHDQIGQQDQRFEELHERLDFTERLLTSRSEVEGEPDEVVTPV
jgi:predicted nuclease with TOPRIM domain